MHSLIYLVVSLFAGLMGSLLGLGGGFILVPVLSIYLGVPVQEAVALSLVSIVINSATTQVQSSQLTNFRVGFFLQVATVSGALIGFIVSDQVNPQWIYFLFSLFLVVSAILMFRKSQKGSLAIGHPFSQKLKLDSSYTLANEKEVFYKVDRPFHALAWMLVAGILSSLLGIGGGILKVLAMDGYMKLPLKVSTSTSNFMIGMTAVTGAMAYMSQGRVRLDLMTPVAIGMMVGAYSGSRVLPFMKDNRIRYLFVFVILFIAIQMLKKALV